MKRSYSKVRDSSGTRLWRTDFSLMDMLMKTMGLSACACRRTSSRGPTPFDGLLKPDLVAPGNKVISLEAPRSSLALTYPELHVSGRGKSGYFELSGTSMSTAVTSGSAALLLQANPALTPAQVKLALQLSASPLPGAGLVEAGAGSLNVLLALQVAVNGPAVAPPEATIAGETVSPGGIAFGSRIIWG